MDTIFSIYEKLIIKEVTYEVGDYTVNATCEMIMNGKSVDVELIMSHTDLNRIIAKIMATGYTFEVKQVNELDFGDGKAIIDYTFENVFGEAIVLENFQFSQDVKQIRA